MSGILKGMNDRIISKHLAETGAYSDLEKPVIVTSGEFLTPFFINTEKLTGSKYISQFLKKQGDDPQKIMDYAWSYAKKNPNFITDLEIIAANVESRLSEIDNPRQAIAGGMRRDIIFSGPIAKILNIPHFTLYKTPDGGNVSRQDIHVVDSNYPSWNNISFKNTFYDGTHVIIISDLLTAGSSQYNVDKKTGLLTGWIPNLRMRNMVVDNAYAVVTREQGGEINLTNVGVNTTAMVAINEDFLNEHALDPQSAINYINAPKAWTTTYLMDNGVEVLVPFFNPNGDKLKRARAFYREYEDFLEGLGLKKELAKKVQNEYKVNLDAILEGK